MQNLRNLTNAELANAEDALSASLRMWNKYAFSCSPENAAEVKRTIDSLAEEKRAINAEWQRRSA